eukprot:TRINITY_DN39697_c0_g1_i1.p1 TRINITY_DN39697_c0_g1~~TRINITY_DN39697_c0_g1_i1.p1  ORF type:complete len:129 (+),score=46.36 TRINITY_DN39697_c0_g1_i1:67-453(+)
MPSPLLEEAFKLLDKDGDGRLSVDEAKTLVAYWATSGAVDEQSAAKRAWIVDPSSVPDRAVKGLECEVAGVTVDGSGADLADLDYEKFCSPDYFGEVPDFVAEGLIVFANSGHEALAKWGMERQAMGQ